MNSIYVAALFLAQAPPNDMTKEMILLLAGALVGTFIGLVVTLLVKP
jgi:hypothetical protein